MAKAPKSSKSGKVAKSYISKAATSGSKVLRSGTSKSSKTAASSAITQRSGSSTKRNQPTVDAVPRYPPGFRNYPGVRMTGPLNSRFYADGDDAVTALVLFQSIQRLFHEAGAERVVLESVQRGSVIANVRAWWNGGDSKVVRNKMMDLAEAGEQWAMDTTANKARAEVSAINASTTAALLAAVDAYDNIAMHVDDFLVIKTTAADGNVNAVVRKLSMKAMKTIEDNPAILNDPRETLNRLSLLSYASDNDLSIDP